MHFTKLYTLAMLTKFRKHTADEAFQRTFIEGDIEVLFISKDVWGFRDMYIYKLNDVNYLEDGFAFRAMCISEDADGTICSTEYASDVEAFSHLIK